MKPTSLSPTIFGGSIALAAILVLTGCRFNPQAAQRIAERGSAGSRPGATAAALTDPTAAAVAEKAVANSITAPTAKAGTAVPAPDTLPPATAAAAATVVATPASGATAPAVSGAPAGPPALTPAPIAVNGAVTSSAALTASTFVPAVNSGEPVAATQAGAESAAPAADTAADEIVDVADDVVGEAAAVLDPAVSADINTPKVVAKRPKVTVRRPRVTAPRRAARSVCTISTRATVNLRNLPTTRSRRVAVLRPRTRFVAVARSSSSRWVYGVSPRGRGWISAATVRCVPAPRALTVRR